MNEIEDIWKFVLFRFCFQVPWFSHYQTVVLNILCDISQTFVLFVDLAESHNIYFNKKYPPNIYGLEGLRGSLYYNACRQRF